MSYILDALKKSEQERELVRMLRTAGTAGHFWAPARRRLWPTIVALALLTGITLTMLRLWWPAQGPVSAVEEKATIPSLPAVAADAREPAVAAPAPPQTPANTAPNKIAASDLAAHVRTPAAPKPAPASRPVADESSSKQDEKSVVKAAMAPIDPITIPFLREMPSAFRSKLPELAVNVHLYSADEAENLVYINNQQYRKGEQLEGGVRLEQIVPEGVVLSYAGTYFKLPRPN